MGGAFTGLANDPSSTFYNPAGLARLEDFALSASLTLNAFDRQRIRKGLQTRQGSTDLKHTSRPALPVFASFVKQIGWREGDTRRHAIGLSTLTVDRRRILLDGSVRERSADQEQVNALAASDERSVRWFGFSYAYRASQALSFGLSTFLSMSRTTHAEEILGVLLENPIDMGMVYQDSAVVVRSTRLKSNVANGIFRLGVLYAFSARLKLGMMFQPPSFRFRGKATVRDRVVTAVALPDTQEASFATNSQEKLEAHDPTPWELRIGTSWAPTYRLLFSLDVSGYGRRGTPSDPVVAIGKRRTNGETGLQPELGVFVLDTWYGKRTANVAWGVEYRMLDFVIVRGGLFTDLSAAHRLPKSSQVYKPSDVNRVGATLSVGLLTRGYDVSVGAATTLGWGNTLAYVADNAETPYARTSMREETFFVFLSGARSTAGKLAEDTYRKVREKLKQRRELDPDP